MTELSDTQFCFGQTCFTIRQFYNGEEYVNDYHKLGRDVYRKPNRSQA